MTAPKRTPAVVTSRLTRSGASIAAETPKSASGSRLMRMATATAVAAMTAASGAEAAEPIRW